MSRIDVYEVLNTRTSEKNGAPPTIEAAAGTVTVLARSGRAIPRTMASGSEMVLMRSRKMRRRRSYFWNTPCVHRKRALPVRCRAGIGISDCMAAI
jgi:hypothetical protein